MSNTGNKAWTTLEQYDVATGVATGIVKPNTIGDPDYVAPVPDTELCAVPTFTFIVTPRMYAAPAAGASFTITVTSSQPWTASVDASWITASPLSGSGNGTIVVTVSQNTQNANKGSSIRITNGALTKYCSITQVSAGFVQPV